MTLICRLVSLACVGHFAVQQVEVPGIYTPYAALSTVIALQSSAAEAMPVTVHRVIARNISNGEVLLQVSYQYHFSGRNIVFVRGIGTMPASASLTYLT